MLDTFKMQEHVCKELDKKSEAGLKSTTDLDSVWKLTDIYKNLLKIDMLQEGSEYSHNDGYSRGDGYSERRKRDSRGRYARDDRYSRDGGYSENYERGNSYRGGYSRDSDMKHERYMDISDFDWRYSV